MRDFIKKIIAWKLDLLARAYIWRFKPEIIAITGNVGKTSAKEAVAVVLEKIKKVRVGKGNLNNEFGVPLTILGDWGKEYYDSSNSLYFWIKVLSVSFFKLIFSKDNPEVLILEYGADHPGDIARLVKKYKPHVGIITAIGKIPVHVEYFTDPDKVAKEKLKLISNLGPMDYAVLNHDDPAVYDMKEKTKARVWSYGFSEGLNVTLSNFYNRTENDKPSGIGFKIHHGPNSFVPVIIDGVLGKAQSLAAGAAVCVGIIYGMNLIEISQALSDYRGSNGRLKILKGIKNSVIIDDTYNAAPSAMHLALETLRDLPAKRRIAVLGDMLELGKYSFEAHEEVGHIAGNVADIIITVGSRGKIIADSAENQVEARNSEDTKRGQTVFNFPTSDLAKLKVQEIIKEGDVILVKGSQGMRMEKVVEEIMAEPERKTELLVRQSRIWLNK